MTITDTPNLLFKYLAPDRADVFLTRTLRYTPLGEFNDPFEGRPNIQGLSTQASAEESFYKLLPESLNNGYANLSKEEKKLLSKDEFIKIALPLMLAQSSRVTATALEQGQEFTQGLPNRMDKIIGALCLTEIPDDLLMWAHYGQSHTGFVIALDAFHPYFHQQKSAEDELRHIRRVLYQESRPTGALSDLTVPQMFLVKSSHWSYEREWRMLMPLTDANQTTETTHGLVHLLRLPAEAIREVIFGVRSSAQLRDTICKLLVRLPELSHVKTKICETDKENFALNVRDYIH